MVAESQVDSSLYCSHSQKHIHNVKCEYIIIKQAILYLHEFEVPDID